MPPKHADVVVSVYLMYSSPYFDESVNIISNGINYGIKMSTYLPTTSGHSSLELHMRMCCHLAINVHASQKTPIDQVSGLIRLINWLCLL